MTYMDVKEVFFDQLWAEVIDQEFSDYQRSSLCILSPDKGGVARARRLADLVGASFASVKKKRVGYDESVAVSLNGDVDGKIVVLVDDIVDTGRTAVEAAELATKHGAQSMFACFAHAVLSGGALEKIKESCFKRVWVTDSLRLHRDFSKSKISVLGMKKWMKKIIVSMR